jgi:hypothetical protein
MFQNWYQQLGNNRLEEAKLLWSFYVPRQELSVLLRFVGKGMD